MNFTISSPGKVILFGEHAVVHGVPAIAASVALHTYITVEKISMKNYVELEFPDVDLVIGWGKSDFHTIMPSGHLPVNEIPTELNPEIVAHAQNIVDATIDESKVFSKTAALAFLYLYISIYFPIVYKLSDAPHLRFKTTSTLPIGAGLGSSASFSVSLAAALLRASGQLTDSTPHELALALISKWSFLGECCIHGKPSGIDNVVATHGGAVFFQRNSKIDTDGTVTQLPPTVKPYVNFPELDLVLTDTTVPRLTSELVARVSRIKQQWPAVFKPLLSTFTEIVKEADNLLSTSPKDPEFVSKLSELADLNHGLLVTVSVSHPALERIREVSKEIGIGTTKLTGAGGGGCAITIASSSFDLEAKHTDISASGAEIHNFREKLGPGYRVFATKLGAKGVGYAEGTADNIVGLTELDWKFW